jgi:hypothetical protein
MTINLTTKEAEQLAAILEDHAGDLQDDGRDESADAKLCYRVAAACRDQVRKAR